MNLPSHSDYFPMTKGAMLFMAIVLFFATLMLAVYLWYGLKLAAIECTLNHLNT